MLAAILSITTLAVLFGLLLGYSAIHFKVEGNPIADQINDLLPQTQCGQCGFAGCRPYAEAMAAGNAEINRCPPGGQTTMLALANLLGKDPVPLDEEAVAPQAKSVAYIREAECIGCTLCLQACPVDAILGAAKQMHSVIIDQCTGCGLCLPPCPVECIDMIPVKETLTTWRWPFPSNPWAEQQQRAS